MTLTITYPSVPNLLIAWFPTVVDQLPVTVSSRAISTGLPAGYRSSLPFVRVSRIGGPRALGIDRALVRIETFAASYDDAETIANALDSLIEWNLHSFNDGAGSVLTTESVTAPQWAPWDDQDVTYFIGTYRLTIGAQH